MPRKIAILMTREFYSGYDGEDYNKLIDSITDWETISDEDFKTLQAASYRRGFQIIEQPVDTKSFIAATIKDYLVMAKAEEAKAAEDKKKREEAALARKFKKELKDRESKLKMLKKLQEELALDSA